MKFQQNSFERFPSVPNTYPTRKIPPLPCNPNYPSPIRHLTFRPLFQLLLPVLVSTTITSTRIYHQAYDCTNESPCLQNYENSPQRITYKTILETFSIAYFSGNGKPETSRRHVTRPLRSGLRSAIEYFRVIKNCPLFKNCPAVITETWLNDNIDNAAIHIPTFCGWTRQHFQDWWRILRFC